MAGLKARATCEGRQPPRAGDGATMTRGSVRAVGASANGASATRAHARRPVGP